MTASVRHLDLALNLVSSLILNLTLSLSVSVGLLTLTRERDIKVLYLGHAGGYQPPHGSIFQGTNAFILAQTRIKILMLRQNLEPYLQPYIQPRL